MTEDHSKWLPRVEALLRKAMDSAATPAESEAAFAKAQELMTKFGIANSMLRIASGEPEKIIRRTFDYLKGYAEAQSVLLNYIVRANGCVLAWSWQPPKKNPGRGRKPLVTGALLFGTESALDRCFLMFAATAVAMQRDTFKVDENMVPWGTTLRAYRDSYAHGWAAAVGKRLVDANKTEIDKTPGAGLVLLSEHDRVEQEVAAAKAGASDLLPARAKSYSAQAMAHGAIDGNKHANTLNQGVGGTRKELRK
mgnify:FL=1